MNTLFEPQSGRLSVPYGPHEDTNLLENPPRFTWMPAKLEQDEYVLQISKSAHFDEGGTHTIQPIPYNFYTPDEALGPGTYYWRYALLLSEEDEVNIENRIEDKRGVSSVLENGQASVAVVTGKRKFTSEWSQIRSFHVPEGLPETPLPGRKERYVHTSKAHPRLWLGAEEVKEFQLSLKGNPDFCGFQNFKTKSVDPWITRPLITEPEPYPENKRVAVLWRKMYMDCQEVLYAVRHLSVAGVLLQDHEMLGRAKEWLLHITSWDPSGTTSRDYNDEAAFRIIGALAWGYDWLYQELDPAEREEVRKVLHTRTAQVAHHITMKSKIHQVPYDSHAVRSLSSVMVPACVALLHEEHTAQEWLDYTIEYYAGLYSPWGGEDGGWAEGPLYWTTGMAFVIDALGLIRNYVSIDFYKRPFFQKTGDFPLYCCSPDTIRASFGDQSYLGDPVSLKTGYNIREFAGVTGNGFYEWYYEQTLRTDTDADSKFYNYGWWDFRFDEMVHQYTYPQIKAIEPSQDNGIVPVKWFKDIGWVAMHHQMNHPEEHIMLLTKSSSYGSMSHSHGDQNSFLLHAYGEPLAIESGYYVAFGSTMHRNWRRQTVSQNNILIDGHGQYAGTNKALCAEAVGKVEQVLSAPGHSYVRMDATQAYLEHVPYLQHYIREIYFLDESYFVIVDRVNLTQPAEVEWMFHTLNEMKLAGQTFQVRGTKAHMEGRFVHSSSGDLTLRQHNEFTGVDPSELEGLERQWHLHAKTEKAQNHLIVTLLVPMKKEESKYISYITDDQDHGVNLYFTNEQGKTKCVEIPKAY